VVLVLAVAVIVGCGVLLARLAPSVFGPTRADRIAQHAARAAPEDLDGVLGPLRDDDAHRRQPVRDLSAVVSRETYRIIQEGVTNALRYAPGQPIAVRIEQQPTALTVQVTLPPDTGAGKG